VAAVVTAAAAAAAVPLAALLAASEAADPLARGSPAHVNGFLFIELFLSTYKTVSHSVSIPLCIKENKPKLNKN
jgi:hypothetical protein